MRKMRRFLLVLSALALGCAGTGGPSLPTNVGSSDPVKEAPPMRTQPKKIDPAAVGEATGGKPEIVDGVVRVTFARDDLPVQVDGWTMPPFMGLTSWVGFIGATKPKAEAMIMGDLVLFEDEVSPVMSALLNGGVAVTALHNHFAHDVPRVYFMHVGGEGKVDTLGAAVKKAMGIVKDVRAKAKTPPDRFGPPPPTTSTIDHGPLDSILGLKGVAKDGMYKATMGRVADASCGCTVGKSMGVNTWAAFAGTMDDAVVDGDFAVTEAELQSVLKSLRGDDIHVVAIHHHMVGETPRILFLHYWGRGRATDLAKTVRRALDMTAWDGKKKPT